MVKVIVVTEAVGSRVIGWVDVDEFDLSAKLLLEGVECDEVVALDNEIFTNNSVCISL
jgi:hypothetical protein